MLGKGQEPTFLDWTEKELVGLNGEGSTVSVTHSRGSRRMVINMFFLYNDVHVRSCVR